MNFRALGINVTGSIALAVYADILGYQRARTQWRENPFLVPEPSFDWSLFWSRVAGGAVMGVLLTLGLSTTTGGAP